MHEQAYTGRVEVRMEGSAHTVPGKAVSLTATSRNSRHRKVRSPEGTKTGAYKYGDIFGYKPVGFLNELELTDFANKHSNPLQLKLSPRNQVKASKDEYKDKRTLNAVKRENVNAKKEISPRSVPRSPAGKDPAPGKSKKRPEQYKSPRTVTDMVDSAYRDRVKRLESENAVLLNSFESLYRENQLLREKLVSVTGKEVTIEPYKQVLADRETLRDAEVTYREHIARLEKDIKDAVQSFLTVSDENKYFRKKVAKLEEKLKKASDDSRQVKELTETVSRLQGKLKKVTGEKRDLELELQKVYRTVLDKERAIQVILGQS